MTARTFSLLRDVIMLVCGLVLLAHETVIVPDPRPILVGVAIAMLGLPATLMADRRFSRSVPPPDELEPATDSTTSPAGSTDQARPS